MNKNVFFNMATEGGPAFLKTIHFISIYFYFMLVKANFRQSSKKPKILI